MPTSNGGDTKVNWLKESLDKMSTKIDSIWKEISSINSRMVRFESAERKIYDHIKDHKRTQDRWWAVIIKVACAGLLWIAGAAGLAWVALKSMNAM